MIAENNFFNIRKGSKWIGSHGSTRGFVDFDSPEYCVRAAWIIICQTYRRRGILTVSQIIKTFAPPKENPTDKYIEFVCSHMSCFPFDIPSSKFDFCRLLSYMSEFEVGTLYHLSVTFITEVVNDFKLEVFNCSK